MHEPMTIERGFYVRAKARGRKQVNRSTATPPCGKARVPRVSRLMALAIRFDQLIRDGVITDQPELAKLRHVTRARMTQIMRLLQLAPDIQEAILWLPDVESGDDGMTERDLREVVSELDWERQRSRWRAKSG